MYIRVCGGLKVRLDAYVRVCGYKYGITYERTCDVRTCVYGMYVGGKCLLMWVCVHAGVWVSECVYVWKCVHI